MPTDQGLGITHIVNTAEGNKAANVTLDVDQLEANGNLFITILIPWTWRWQSAPYKLLMILLALDVNEEISLLWQLTRS